MHLGIILKVTGLVSTLGLIVILILCTILLPQHQADIQIKEYSYSINPFMSWTLSLLPFIITSIILLSIGNFFEFKYKQLKKNRELTIYKKAVNSLLGKIGIVLLIISPLIFFSIPLYFTNLICTSNFFYGCGYANLGIIGYMLLFSLPFFITGIILIMIAYLTKKRLLISHREQK